MKDKRQDISKPKVFKERRSSMWLIESASPQDIYLWCLCIVVMSVTLFTSLILSYVNYKGV